MRKRIAMDTSYAAPSEPWMITLAASAGGIDALTTILRTLPPDLPAASWCSTGPRGRDTTTLRRFSSALPRCRS